MKTCSRCHLELPHERFNDDHRYASGLTSYCKDCQRVYGRARRYGMTVEEFTALFTAQDGACASCGDPVAIDAKGTHVDHCHATDRIRGILCRGCNMALGCLKDDPTRIQALADYLERSEVDCLV